MNIKSFTSLRGLACLAVVGTHVWTLFDLQRLITARYGVDSFQNKIAIFVDRTFNGQAAVEVFFVLSGCVLALSLMSGSAANKPSWVKTFYVKRFFRIYPALWLSIAANNEVARFKRRRPLRLITWRVLLIRDTRPR